MKKFNTLRLDLAEKTLTPAEKKKREEIAMAMERENPGMPMGKKMAIATATAKRVAEENLDELKTDTLDSYITRVATGPSRGNTQTGIPKSIKAIGGVTTALRKKAENNNPPFEPDAPKKNPSAVAGKYGAGYSTAKHLAKQGMKSVSEEIKTTHEDPLVVTKDEDGNIHTHANLSVANAIHGTDVKHQAIHSYRAVQAGKFTFELSKHHASEVKEAKEKSEYDYEGDMARGQLQSIIMNAQRVHDMLKDNDNLPEWVQSKITLAEDYISTVSNYMASEIDEMHLSFGSQDKKPAPVTSKLADMKKYFATNDKDQIKQKITGKKFHDMSEYETWMKSNKTKSAMQVASFEQDAEKSIEETSHTFEPVKNQGLVKNNRGHSFVGNTYNAKGLKGASIYKHKETGKYYANKVTSNTTYHDSAEKAAEKYHSNAK
jgi:hypothetical protein